MPRLSLAARLVLILGGTLFLLQLLALIVQASRDDGLNLSGIRGDSAREVARLVRLFEQQAPLRQRLALELLNTDRYQIALADTPPAPVSAGPMLSFTSQSIRQRIAAEGISADRIDVSYVFNNPLTPARGLLARVFGRHLRITVALNGGSYLVIDPGNDVDAYAFGTVVAFGAAILAVIILVGSIFGILRETRPLRTLTRNLDAFGRTASPAALKEEGAPELRRLVRVTNDMQQQIASLMRNRELILSGMSHDLRTQVTRLRLRLELLPESEARTRAIGDVDAMQALIEQSLTFAAMETPSDKDRTDLTALLDRIASERAASQPGAITWTGSERLAVAISETAMRRVLDNLIDNAIAYGQSAELTLERTKDTAILRVADRGPGIPDEYRQAVFEPFFRLETSRNRASGGSGLGLAIVAQIVGRYHGTIAIEDNSGGGAVFVLRLPRAN